MHTDFERLKEELRNEIKGLEKKTKIIQSQVMPTTMRIQRPKINYEEQIR